MTLEPSVQITLITVVGGLVGGIFAGLGRLAHKLLDKVLAFLGEEWSKKVAVQNKSLEILERIDRTLTGLNTETAKNTTALADLATAITGDLKPRVSAPPESPR